MMEKKRTTSALYRKLSLIIFVPLCLVLILSAFTATASAEETEVIAIKAELTVHLYDSFPEMRNVYVNRGGKQDIMHKVKGFYSDRDNSIHCVKWDFTTCGHELFHALQYKGDQTLLAGKGYEHFKENNYTSQ